MPLAVDGGVVCSIPNDARLSLTSSRRQGCISLPGPSGRRLPAECTCPQVTVEHCAVCLLFPGQEGRFSVLPAGGRPSTPYLPPANLGSSPSPRSASTGSPVGYIKTVSRQYLSICITFLILILYRVYLSFYHTVPFLIVSHIRCHHG